MKKLLLVLIMMVVAVIAFAADKIINDIPIAKLTLRAVDESGQAITGASVTMDFEPSFLTGGAITYAKGLTNARGEFAGEGHSYDRQGGQIEKEGYYFSSPESYKFTKVVEGKWQPWNPTLDVVLKKIIHPIPLYARRVDVQLPVLDKPVGFDLEAADWVAPYGKGTNSDFIFKVTKRVASSEDYDAKLALIFGSKADGIQTMPADKSGSELHSPHTAPETEYEPSLALGRGSSAQKGEYGTDVQNSAYFFRVRARADEDGKVTGGLYGKIYGGIECFPLDSQTAQIRFLYFLNPTAADKNLEFDPKQNLFKDLKRMEKVKER